mmetsp:Transcript_12782/g.41979  ORF Transcript_12782/g.41979 Transcript_12782/m.41979 type:complete len:140 (+) Transcript_12782:457-876(+)
MEEYDMNQAVEVRRKNMVGGSESKLNAKNAWGTSTGYAEELKKKGGKSVLSGKDLYALKKDLFVDDAEADDGPIEREKEAADEGYDENGAALDQEESRPVDAAGVEVTIDGAATAVNAALYGGDDGIDDLDDLDDLDDD